MNIYNSIILMFEREPENAFPDHVQDFIELIDPDTLVLTQDQFRNSLLSSASKYDRLISTFNSIYANSEYTEVYSDKLTVRIYRKGEGSYIMKNSSGRHLYFKSNRANGHYCLNIENSTWTLERFLLIGKCIFEDAFPPSFDNLVANMIDLTGSTVTATKLNKECNFTMENVELATKETNIAHGRKCGSIYSDITVRRTPI